MNVTSSGNSPVFISIGILAWNEEGSIGSMLDSLFEQSIFAWCAEKGVRCEVFCLANGCTDRTVAIASETFERMNATHPARAGLAARVLDMPEPGRNRAWNRFVHEFSAPEAAYICVMDADIVFNHPQTLERVVGALERDPHLKGASDRPVKSIAEKERPSLRDRMSLATSDMTSTIVGRLNGQLYCLRARTARNLYLPRDVVANDDGFFKALICTDFFTAPLDETSVVSLPDATHLYEAYLPIQDVLNNQKRQMIGQTTVHVAIEYLKGLPKADRRRMAQTLRYLDERDPDWLKRRVAAHLAGVKHFWQLFPGLLSFRWRRWAALHGWRRLTHFSAAAAGFAVTLVASWRAYHFLRGGVAVYWPKAGKHATPGRALATAK